MGWLAVALVQLDPATITQMAMQSSLLAEPIMLHLSIYGQMFPDDVIQIAVFVVPCKSNEEPTQQDIPSPPNYSPIAFSHTIQAWPGERIQLELQGRLEPDVTAGETDLRYEFEVQMLNRICEKWVKLTSKTAPLSGKLVVRSQRRGQWERVTEINLSSRTGHTRTSSSSDNPWCGVAHFLVLLSTAALCDYARTSSVYFYFVTFSNFLMACFLFMSHCVFLCCLYNASATHVAIATYFRLWITGN